MPPKTYGKIGVFLLLVRLLSQCGKSTGFMDKLYSIPGHQTSTQIQMESKNNKTPSRNLNQSGYN